MADLGNSAYSETDAGNSAAPPDGWPEGQNPSTVNNCARAMMGAEKRFWDRINPTLTTAGTTSAYTLTYAVAEAAYYDGELFCFIVNATCAGAPTLNINALGARQLRKFTAGAYANLAASDLVANQPVLVRYNLSATTFDVIASAFNLTDFARLTVANTWTAVQTLSAVALNEAQGTNIASATTTDIGAALGNYVHVTGTTTITGLGTIQAGTRRKVVFDGILTLTHNATSLICITGASITTAAGDIAEFESEGSGNWRMTSYERATGVPIVPYPAFTQITNSLGADVAINVINTDFTGPTIAQGTTGTWWASGQITIDGQQTGSLFKVRLWDGTTVIDSASVTMIGTSPGGMDVHLSGYLASPAGNIRITLQCTNATVNIIRANLSGYSKDSTLSAIRIA